MNVYILFLKSSVQGAARSTSLVSRLSLGLERADLVRIDHRDSCHPPRDLECRESSARVCGTRVNLDAVPCTLGVKPLYRRITVLAAAMAGRLGPRARETPLYYYALSTKAPLGVHPSCTDGTPRLSTAHPSSHTPQLTPQLTPSPGQAAAAARGGGARSIPRRRSCTWSGSGLGRW